jgi:hypothetical protein
MKNDLPEDAIYYDLEIHCDSAVTEIWLICDRGHLVQHEYGVMRTCVLSGDYIVCFQLGSTYYPIHLNANSRYTQQEIESGPSCPRPKIRLTNPDEIIG